MNALNWLPQSAVGVESEKKHEAISPWEVGKEFSYCKRISLIIGPCCCDQLPKGTRIDAAGKNPLPSCSLALHEKKDC